MTAVLHTESSMNLGGQELRVLIEMEGLAGRGFRPVLAARPGSRILDEAARRGLKAYPVEMRGSLDPVAVAAFVRIMRGEGITLVNAHGSKDGWSAGIAARLLGIKIIRSRHVANPIRGHLAGRLAYTALCDAVVTTSESIKRGIAEKGVPEGKITSVPTGVDVAVYHPGVPKGAFRAELGIPANVPLVGMVSVMRGDKGPDVFVRAAEVVLAEVPEAFFAMVGDGWMLEKVRAMASASPNSDRIRLTGYRRDIPSVMADLDVLVLPARIPEGVPQVILQAHAMKVPVVASAVGGIDEVAVDGKTALCAPPGDHQEVAVRVVSLLKDRALAASLAEAGHRLVMEKYTLAGMLDRMEKIYRSVMGDDFRR